MAVVLFFVKHFRPILAGGWRRFRSRTRRPPPFSSMKAFGCAPFRLTTKVVVK
jgi:hypothetical protein